MGIDKDRAIEMLRIITENLIADAGSEEIKSAYKDLGFSDEEIDQLYNW